MRTLITISKAQITLMRRVSRTSKMISLAGKRVEFQLGWIVYTSCFNKMKPSLRKPSKKTYAIAMRPKSWYRKASIWRHSTSYRKCVQFHIIRPRLLPLSLQTLLLTKKTGFKKSFIFLSNDPFVLMMIPGNEHFLDKFLKRSNGSCWAKQ